jgi:ABC-2 type transport system permease protein
MSDKQLSRGAREPGSGGSRIEDRGTQRVPEIAPRNPQSSILDPRSSAPSPPWWIVFSRELRDLWIGGKALHLILIYTILLGIYSYLFASNAEVNLMPLKEMVLEVVKASIAVSLFISLIIGADSFSGERERATLEGLLLTPASRRQIVAGKFLAAISPWPVALAITVPYWAVLSKGDAVFGQAVLWGAVTGSLLAPALAGLGMLASIGSNTSKTSLLISLGLYLLLLIPTELAGPAKIQRGAELKFRVDVLQGMNPMAATSRFLKEVLLNNAPPVELWFWLTMPVLFLVLILVLLFVYASPGLRLDAGTASRFRSYWGGWRRVVGLSVPQK